MKTLILPIAGESSRFPGMRPKWLLTMPDGKIMLEKAVEILDMANYDRVVVVCLKKHLDSYLTDESFNAILAGIPHPNVDSCILMQSTSSQSETVAMALKEANIQGAFFVKDCDNTFNVKWGGGNEVAVLDLNSVSLVDAKNKSYVSVDSLENISNIVEKQVISNYFCCGGYGFESSAEFLSHFHSIKSKKEVYISHVIYSMLMDSKRFRIIKANSYIDWGTLREFRHYSKSYITVFCDVDGVLMENGSKFGKKGWKTEPIRENLHIISNLQKDGKLYLVITSSRPEAEVDYLRDRLLEFDVRPNKYVMGLPHSQRILINDYSATNLYPTAIAINLERDSESLSLILKSIEI
jgi:hypothetical protein